MKRIGISIIAILFVSIFASCSAYASINVDGYLHDDWGVTPGVFGSSDWTPNGGIISTVEDQNTIKLTPGWGGQYYDAEAMYWKRESGSIYMAIVTGHPAPTLAQPAWYPGDIFFNFGAGKQYGLKTTGDDIRRLYKNPLWNTSSSPWGGITTMQDGTGTDKGLTNFVYLNTYPSYTYPNDHWVMEMAIPESYFGSDWMSGGTIRWTMECNNDIIELPVPPSSIPEPASMALVGMGLAGLLKFRKRQVGR